MDPNVFRVNRHSPNHIRNQSRSSNAKSVVGMANMTYQSIGNQSQKNNQTNLNRSGVGYKLPSSGGSNGGHLVGL
jgi:hypothetical protein